MLNFNLTRKQLVKIEVAGVILSTSMTFILFCLASFKLTSYMLAIIFEIITLVYVNILYNDVCSRKTFNEQKSNKKVAK